MAFCTLHSDSNCLDLMVLYSQQDRENVPVDDEEYRTESSGTTSEVESEVEQEDSINPGICPLQKVLLPYCAGAQNSSGRSGSGSKGNWKILSSEVSCTWHKC